jgi:hypothetical protein
MRVDFKSLFGGFFILLTTIGMVSGCLSKTAPPVLPTWSFVHDVTLSQTQDPVKDCIKAHEGDNKGHCLQGLESAMVWDNKAEEGTTLSYWPASSDMAKMRRQFPDVENTYQRLDGLFNTDKPWEQVDLENVLRTLDQCPFQECQMLSEHPEFRLPFWEKGRLFSVLVTAEAGASTKHIQLFAIGQRRASAPPVDTTSDMTQEYFLISSWMPIPARITKQCLAERQQRLEKGEKEPVPAPVERMETWPFERECYLRTLPQSPEITAEAIKRRMLWPEQFKLKRPRDK